MTDGNVKLCFFESELTMNWRDQAACIGEDVELFFAVGSSGPALDQIEWAKAMCSRCKVTHCLEWAIETNQQDAVWGGKSEDERRALRRDRQRRRNKLPKPAGAHRQ